MNTWLTIRVGEFVQLFVEAPAWAVLVAKVTAILAAAWLVHFALRRANPRWRVLLWRMTAVGLIALPPAALLLPAINIRVQQAAPVTEPADMPSPAPYLMADRDVTATSQGGFADDVPDSPDIHRLPTRPSEPSENVGPSPLPLEASLPASLNPKPAVITVSQVLLAIWLGGILFFACRLCLGYSRIRQMARGTQAPPQWVCEECLRVAQTLDCRGRVEVLQSAAIQSPLLCGLRRVRLLLPAAMCGETYRADLPAILAHELAHVRSRDLLWNFGLHLVSLPLWFHPFAWRMRRAHLAACELVSDAVSANFIGDVSEYCRTLARVAVRAYTTIPATGIAMARRSSISRRLSALQRYVFSRPLRRRSAIGFGVAALLTVALLGVLRIALAAPPAVESAAVASTETKTAETLAPETKTAEKDAKPAEAIKSDAKPRTGSIRVLVLDPQGKPLPDADVHATTLAEGMGSKADRDYRTDAAGIAVVELPKTFFFLSLSARKSPLVTMVADWNENKLASGKAIPESFTFRLESGVTAGGRILNEQGKPIVGAKVQVMLRNTNPANGDGRARYDHLLAYGTEAATTVADGRWRIDNFPRNAQATVLLKVSHPDYISDGYWGSMQRDVGITTAMLRNGTAVITLKRGIVVRGRVMDSAGKPIKDAVIGWSPGDGPTDADDRGWFHLPPLPSGERLLMIIAPNFAPLSRDLNIQAGLPLQEFHMAPGKPIHLRLVDSNGKPIPDAWVQIKGWGGKSHYINHPKIPEFADKNGVWEWTGAPDDLVSLSLVSRGFAPCELEIAGGAPPRTVTLKAEPRITGTVTDAATGKPIQAFTIIPIDVFRKGWLSAERMNATSGEDGRLNYSAIRSDIPLQLRIEATGYRTQTGPEFRVGDDTPRTQDFHLQPSPPINGVVYDVSARPVAKAEVQLATPTETARSGDFGLPTVGHTAITESNGQFSFPDPGESFTVLVQADAGFAQATFPAGQHDAGTLHLQPWASVRGQFRDGGQPVERARLYLEPVQFYNDGRPGINDILHSSTDVQGRFEFPRVPPVPARLYVGLRAGQDASFRSGPSVPLELKPGQHVELNLGGGPTIVKGKVTLTGALPTDLDYKYSDNYLVRRAPGIAPPPEIATAGFDARKGWRSVWRKSIEGIVYLRTLQHWFVKLSPDGAFRISGVPPGEYDLAIAVYAKPRGVDLEDLRAQKVVRVTVTAEDVARGELTLPEITAPVVPSPAVGDVPALSFERADNTTGSLADFHGRWTVVQFWASWCNRSTQELPALRQLQERFAARKLNLLGLSLEENRSAWEEALKRLDLSWPRGRVAADGGGVGAPFLPEYWLLDPAGKIVAKVHQIDELDKLLAERLK